MEHAWDVGLLIQISTVTVPVLRYKWSTDDSSYCNTNTLVYPAIVVAKDNRNNWFIGLDKQFII